MNPLQAVHSVAKINIFTLSFKKINCRLKTQGETFNELDRNTNLAIIFVIFCKLLLPSNLFDRKYLHYYNTHIHEAN